MNNTEKRFWKHVHKDSPSDCWIWTGSKTSFGYGQIGISGKTTPAHRVSWVIHNGEIPDGMLVCHKCDNPSCVNPNHLFLGTQKDNMKDMSKKNRKYKQTCWRGAFGDKHPSSKLTNEQVREIRKFYAQGRLSTYSLGTLYKVDPSTIWLIVKNKTYVNI